MGEKVFSVYLVHEGACTFKRYAALHPPCNFIVAIACLYTSAYLLQTLRDGCNYGGSGFAFQCKAHPLHKLLLGAWALATALFARPAWILLGYRLDTAWILLGYCLDTAW
ncbi:MAG: hypothetical protein KBB43_00040, partial [Brachymonas sp.]|nr:hypothetical protein [Brachymonas sp.]